MSRSNIQYAGIAILVVAAIVLIGIAVTAVGQKDTAPVSGIEYVNNDYGFAFSLPESWKGYTVTIDRWTGSEAGDQLGDVAYTDGPVVSIHNPKWSGANTYQDIPIMVFTTAQWDDLTADKFHIGAAPVNPTELARNSKYVFALPARYNYGYLTGFEEVEQILQSDPIKVFKYVSQGGSGGILPYNSGVKGTVLFGPTCPVMRDPPDPQCADKPYATTIQIYRTGSSSVFATGKSNENGAFEFSLPPGEYTLSASLGKMLPRCNDENVTVGASGYSTVNISCDTGIR